MFWMLKRFSFPMIFVVAASKRRCIALAFSNGGDGNILLRASTSSSNHPKRTVAATFFPLSHQKTRGERSMPLLQIPSSSTAMDDDDDDDDGSSRGVGGRNDGNGIGGMVVAAGDRLRMGYRRRVRADPAFARKSATEIALATLTHLAAECNRRGIARIVPEIDFVFPALLTAVFGKYYSMWSVARTMDAGDDDVVGATGRTTGDVGRAAAPMRRRTRDAMLLGRIPVPTNAFQPYLMDGATRPTVGQRFGSFLAPVASLFRAGLLSSFVGYGLVALVIAIRVLLLPSYVAATIPVNVLHASIYTGCFMATVSNIRYQVLQGIVEPVLERAFRSAPPMAGKAAIFVARATNGLLGSVLAIAGMRRLGLQKMK